MRRWGEQATGIDEGDVVYVHSSIIFDKIDPVLAIVVDVDDNDILPLYKLLHVDGREKWVASWQLEVIIKRFMVLLGATDV
jgi:hypothetical protein